MTHLDVNSFSITYSVVFSTQSFVAQGRKPIQSPAGSAALSVPGSFDGRGGEVGSRLRVQNSSVTPCSTLPTQADTQGGCKNKPSYLGSMSLGPVCWLTASLIFPRTAYM